MRDNKFHVGILLISIASLALEISYLRFFSIAQWYHFAFMIISIALFGMAVAGTFLSIIKLKSPFFLASILFSLSILAGFFVFNKIMFDPFQAIIDIKHIFILLVYYFLLGLPFFFFGIIIASAFSSFQKDSGKIYFFNMLGSAIGAIIPLFLFSYFNVKIILVISLIGLSSSILFQQNPFHNIIFLKIKNIHIVSLLILINILLFFLPVKINISKYKELSQALNVPNSRLIATKYNSFSRIDIVKSSFTRYAPGLSIKYEKNLPDQIGITIDAGNMNSITEYTNLGFIDYLPSAIPYFLTKNKKTLIINAGAGLDVLCALNKHAKVSALESNPVVIDLLKNEYADFSGNIYNKANVIWDNGRSFVKKYNQKGKFDIIVLSLAGNVLSDSAGFSGMNQNYLLTGEAFQDYYNILNENGFLVVTRWLLFPPRETLRLFSLAYEIDKQAKKTILFRSWTTITLVLSKKNLDAEIINKTKQFLDKNQFDIIYMPADFVPNKHLKFKEPYYCNAVQNLLKNKTKFYQDYVFDVTPVTDNKPFYFNFFKISKIKKLYKLIGDKYWNPFFDSGFILLLIFIQALVGSIIFILLPLYFFNRKKQIRKKPLLYFFLIGLSYLFIELVLIQKFILFLGHIIFSSSIIIFSMLLFSSLGALYSQKIKLRKLKSIIIIIFIFIILYMFLLNVFINLLISQNLIVKIILSAVFTAPLSFVMGIPFPLGIRIIRKEHISWAWAFNGTASVLSPILAIFIALFSGYNIVWISAGFLYLAGVLFILPELSRLKEQT